MIRQEVADFIAERDTHRPNPDHIFLTDGASVGVKMVLQAIIRDERDAVLVPIPQYPLYSATCALLGRSLMGHWHSTGASTGHLLCARSAMWQWWHSAGWGAYGQLAAAMALDQVDLSD